MSIRTILAAFALLLGASMAAHAQQAQWLWWGTNPTTTAPVSAANPLPVTATGGLTVMKTDASNAVLPTARDNLNDGLIVRSVLDFGAKCDVVNVGSGNYTIPAGSTTLTLTSGTFGSIGTAKQAVLPGHAAGGAVLVTTLTPTDTTHATLGAASVPGTTNEFYVTGSAAAAGTGYAPADTITLTGGTLATTGGANAVMTVKRTKVVSVAIKTAGSGGANGTYLVYGTTGNGNRGVFSLTVAGGIATAVAVSGTGTDAGHYTSNPTGTPAAGLIPESVATSAPGFTLPTGLVLNLGMGVDLAQPTTPGLYANGGEPTNPVAQGATSGSGSGATFTMTLAFNNSGFAYGTDDSAAVQTALNPASWTSGQGGAQVGATITVPGTNCGIASTVTVSGQSTRLVGTQPGRLQFQATNNPQGSAFQWLGAAAGTMFSWTPPNGSTTPLGGNNGISNIAIECGVPSGSNQKVSTPLAGIGLNLLSQSYGDWGGIYLDACSDKDIYISTIASGSGVQDAIGNYIHDLTFINPLDWDGVGLYQTGTVLGNGDFNDIRRLTSVYRNRPSLYLAALDNTRVTSLHFVQRPSPAAGWYGLDIAGSIYGSGDVTPPQDSTAVMSNISSTSIMRGVESATTPPTAVLIYGFDSTNSIAKTVLQPGHGSVFWTDENGLAGGSNGGLVLSGGNDGITGPLVAFTETPTTAAACRAAAIASGGSASSYFCNTNGGYNLVLDDLTNRWGIALSSGNLLLNRAAGSGVVVMSGSNGTNARIGDFGAAGYVGLSLNNASFTTANMNFFSDAAGDDFTMNRPTGGSIHFRENNGADQVTIATSTGRLTAAGGITTTSGLLSGLTGLAIRDTSAAFDVTIAGTSSTALNAGRTLTLDMKNVAHTLAFNATANTITFPNTSSYTLIGSGDTGTVTQTMIASGTPVACGSTCTLGASNKGTYTRLDTAGGSVATLPGATGTGNTYKLYVSVATTSAADKVLTNPTTDTIIGTAIGENAGTAKVFVGNAGTFHSIQMPFTGSQPSGGFIGDTIVCTDVASTIWKCDINYQGGTTPTTPYSASTS